MYGTIFSILIALALLFNPFQTSVVPDGSLMGLTLIIVASLFVILQVVVKALFMPPLLQAEHKFTPKISALYREDKSLRFTTFWLFFFVLVSYALSIDFLFIKSLPPVPLLAIWLVFLGVSIDLIYRSLNRSQEFLDPFFVTQIVENKGLQEIQNQDTKGLCSSIDALVEIATKGTLRSSLSLANDSLSRCPSLIKNLFAAGKNIGNHLSNDELLFPLFYLLERLEYLSVKAVETKNDPVLVHLVNVLGKIAVSGAEFDPSVVAYPLQTLGRVVEEAQHADLIEVVNKATCTLVGTAAEICQKTDLTYMEIKDPFYVLIHELEDMVKEEFKRDKTINIQILKQPFEEILTLFQTDKMRNHKDTPDIVAELNRVLGEFTELDTIMRTLPPMESVPE